LLHWNNRVAIIRSENSQLAFSGQYLTVTVVGFGEVCFRRVPGSIGQQASSTDTRFVSADLTRREAWLPAQLGSVGA
jgi:hypothetical protein